MIKTQLILNERSTSLWVERVRRFGGQEVVPEGKKPQKRNLKLGCVALTFIILKQIFVVSPDNVTHAINLQEAFITKRRLSDHKCALMSESGKIKIKWGLWNQKADMKNKVSIQNHQANFNSTTFLKEIGNSFCRFLSQSGEIQPGGVLPRRHAKFPPDDEAVPLYQ